jgi:dihydrofolate reductase
MRPLVVFNRITPEGYFAAAGDDMSWFVPDPDIERAGVAGIPQADAAIFGRRTYQQFASFWPKLSNESGTATDPHGGGQTEAAQAFATALNRMTKWVFSRSLQHPEWSGSRLIRSFDPEQVRAWKREAGKGIMVFGSGSIVSLLAEHALVDEYHLVVSPVLLGRGRPLFDGVTQRTPLRLIEAQATRAGNVSMRYAPA